MGDVGAKEVGMTVRSLSARRFGHGVLVRAGLLYAALAFCAVAANSVSVSPKRLVEVVDIVGPVVSPDGTRVAFRSQYASVESDAYHTVWYIQRLDGKSPPRRVADGGIPIRDHSTGLSIPVIPTWLPDGSAILYRALIDGRVAVWRAAADGSGAMPVTFDPADIRSFALETDGRVLRYSVGATREEVAAAELKEYDSGVHIDETVFIGAGLFRSSRLHGRATTQRFVGTWFEPAPLLTKVPDRWRQVDLDSLEVRDAAAIEQSEPVADIPDPVDPWKWASNPESGHIALLSRVGEAAGRFAKPDVELSVSQDAVSDQVLKCTESLCTGKNITGLQWRPRRDEVLFTVTDRQRGRAQSIYRWIPRSGTVVPVVESRGMLGGDSTSQRFQEVPCGVSADVLACVTAEADRPPRLEVIAIDTGQRTVLFDPNAALALDVAETTPAKLLRWRDEHGDEFSGWFFAARSDSPTPLFVTYYSCEGFLRGGVGDEWPLMSLAGHGISSLCINSNPGYLDVVRYYDQGLGAVKGAVDTLVASGRVDPARVGMGGLSYGSEVTMWTLMQSDLLVAASVASPSLTPNWYLFNSLRDGFRTGVTRNWQLGGPDETPERWEMMSPAFKLDSIAAPVLLQMPEQEYLMAVEYAIPLVRMGKGDMYVFPDEAHIKFRPRHKMAAYERNLDWFRFWLQGYEETSPRKASQYARWRFMRDRHPVGVLGARTSDQSP